MYVVRRYAVLLDVMMHCQTLRLGLDKVFDIYYYRFTNCNLVKNSDSVLCMCTQVLNLIRRQTL